MIPRHPDTLASSAEDHQELPGLRDGGEPSLLILADMSGQLHCLGGEGTGQPCGLSLRMLLWHSLLINPQCPPHETSQENILWAHHHE